MMVAANAVCELLNRLHPFRKGHLYEYAHQALEVTEGYWCNTPEEYFGVDDYLAGKIGRGNLLPFLELVDLEPLALC